MARYGYGTPVNWPQDVPHGKVKCTKQQDGTLVSLGRHTARGGVKHLGILSNAEMLAVWAELGKQLSQKGLIQSAVAS